MHRTSGKAIPKRLQAFALICCVVFSAACLVFSDLQACHDADSLMLSIISTQHWTPFFWGTDRYGMLLPLLASPWKNPLTNLAVQHILSISLCLALPMLAARFLFRFPLWPAVGALVSAFFIGLFPGCVLFPQYASQCYYPALTLCFSGILLLSRRNGPTAHCGLPSGLAGVILVLASFWITPTLILTVLPIVIVLGFTPGPRSTIREAPASRGEPGGPWRRTVSVFLRGFHHDSFRIIGLLVIALGFSVLLSGLSMYKTGYRFLPPAQWPHGWLSLMQNVVTDLLPTRTIRGGGGGGGPHWVVRPGGSALDSASSHARGTDPCSGLPGGPGGRCVRNPDRGDKRLGKEQWVRGAGTCPSA